MRQHNAASGPGIPDRYGVSVFGCSARDFYVHYDFEPSPSDPDHLLLIMTDRLNIRDERN